MDKKRTVKEGLILGLVLLLFLTITTAIGVYCYEQPNNTNNNPKKKVVLIVNKDETGNSITNQLFDKGLIHSKTLFKIALRLTGTMDKLQAGYYKFDSNSSMRTIILELQKGQTKTVKVTIPEGFTIQQIAKSLEEAKLVSKKDFLDTARTFVPYSYMYGPTPEEYHVEGFLFPDTYYIPENYTPKQILEMMTKETNNKLTPKIRADIKAKGLSIYQFITLASLVEREALFDKDRPIIAAVFEKRLKQGIPLQSCASVEYVLGARKQFLSLEDIEIESPYNTYKHKGLPPGPISNPGIKSIEAVLYAPTTEYLYFVADKKGVHHFSKTYDEHLREIEKIYGTDGSH